jgi:hypothetical protein
LEWQKNQDSQKENQGKSITVAIAETTAIYQHPGGEDRREPLNEMAAQIYPC